MTNETTMLFDKSLSLQSLGQQISAEEARIGPLKALGRTAGDSAATYKPGKRPKQPVELIQKVGDTAVIPDGHSKVCEGNVWITGQPQAVVAIRMKVQ